MNSIPKDFPEAAVYDPSHRCSDTGSYWQWTNGELGQIWDGAAECVNQGWPVKCDFSDQSWRWYGVIFDHPGNFWLYRLFAAGKDRFGRDGRYFFVLVRLQSAEDILSPRVAGLFRYFDAERSLPLKIHPLEHGWPDASPDEILEAIREELNCAQSAGHWGMDDSRGILRFTTEYTLQGEPPNQPPEPPAKEFSPTTASGPPGLPLPLPLPLARQKSKMKLPIVLVVLLVSTFLLIHILEPTHRQMDISPQQEDSRVDPPVKINNGKGRYPNKGDGKQPRQRVDPSQEPHREDKDRPYRNPKPMEVEDPSISPDRPTQPSSKTPDTQQEP
jgi:hypothetical protein